MSTSPYFAIVDDDDSARKALARLLRAHGIATLGYASGAEFLTSLRDAPPPACVLLDMFMPLLGGLEVQTALNRRTVAIPVVFITAHDDAVISGRAFSAGAIAFLSKPVDEAVLLRTIAPFRAQLAPETT